MTGRGASAGTYYYTGTGSVANLVSGSGAVSYAYGTDGSRSPYGEENVLLHAATQAAAYGYNGEYTHESLGMQYLRARYLNMGTGTFLSRDSYGGAMDNIFVIVNKKVPLLSEKIPHLFLRLYRWGIPTDKNPVI